MNKVEQILNSTKIKTVSDAEKMRERLLNEFKIHAPEKDVHGRTLYKGDYVFVEFFNPGGSKEGECICEIVSEDRLVKVVKGTPKWNSYFIDFSYTEINKSKYSPISDSLLWMILTDEEEKTLPDHYYKDIWNSRIDSRLEHGATNRNINMIANCFADIDEEILNVAKELVKNKKNPVELAAKIDILELILCNQIKSRFDKRDYEIERRKYVKELLLKCKL